MSDQKRDISPFDWALVYYWIMATTAGWLFGWLLLPILVPVTPGVGAGIVQSVVLAHRIPKAWRWIVATAVGWLVGRILVFPVAPDGLGVVSGLVIGAATGLAQWVLLRKEIHWAGWWIAITALAWSTGLGLAPAAESVLLPRIVLAGMLPSVPTGITIGLLLRHPKKSVQPKS